MRWLLLAFALILTACNGASSADYSAQGQAALANATASAANARAAMTSEAWPYVVATHAAYAAMTTATAAAIPTATATPEPTTTPTVKPTATPEPTTTPSPTPTPESVAVSVLIVVTATHEPTPTPTATAPARENAPDQPRNFSLFQIALILFGAILIFVVTLLIVWRVFLHPRTTIKP